MSAVSQRPGEMVDRLGEPVGGRHDECIDAHPATSLFLCVLTLCAVFYWHDFKLHAYT